jgi:hypothetical protein
LLKNLTAAQKAALLNGIKKMEGTIVGKAAYYVPPGAGGGAKGTTYIPQIADPNLSYFTSTTPTGTVTVIVQTPPAGYCAINAPIPSGSETETGDESGDPDDDDDGGGGDGSGGEDSFRSLVLKMHVTQVAPAHLTPAAASNKLVQAMAAFKVSSGFATEKMSEIQEHKFVLAPSRH